MFIPLGGSRGGQWFSTRNIVITFTISGLWHGANWTYVVWGLLNGLAYIPLLVLGKTKESTGVVAQNSKLPSPQELLKMLLTFNFTLLAWVFFRAENLGHAWYILKRLVTVSWFGDFNGGIVLLHVIYGLILLACEWPQRQKTHALQIEGVRQYYRWAIYCGLISILFVLGFFGETTFIYFQF